MSEEELVRKARDGDDQAFMELVHSYESSVFRLAMALLRHREDAEDATQETFVLAFRRLRTLKELGSFPLWLRRLAIRVCLRHLRHRKVEHEVVEPLSEEHESEILFHSHLDPEVEAERAELRALVRRMIAELPEPFQVVVVLYHMDGLSYEEIAKVLKIPVGTVRSRLARARAILREKLAPLVQQLGLLSESEPSKQPTLESVASRTSQTLVPRKAKRFLSDGKGDD